MLVNTPNLSVGRFAPLLSGLAFSVDPIFSDFEQDRNFKVPTVLTLKNVKMSDINDTR